MKKLKKENSGFADQILLFVAVFVLIVVGFVGYRVYKTKGSNNEQSQAEASTRTPKLRGATFKKYQKEKVVKFWKSSKEYDLSTLKVSGHYAKGETLRTGYLVYKKGGFFYLNKKAFLKGKYKGVFISDAFVTRPGGYAEFGNNVFRTRNGMPLTTQLTKGGTCTSKRVWYSGLNNNLTEALQKVQMKLYKKIPFNTAYRTYDEQVCLWNKYGRNPSRVAPPGTSKHNKGLAVDIDSTFAAQNAPLMRQYNLCQRVAGEPWHFELCN